MEKLLAEPAGRGGRVIAAAELARRGVTALPLLQRIPVDRRSMVDAQRGVCREQGGERVLKSVPKLQGSSKEEVRPEQ